MFVVYIHELLGQKYMLKSSSSLMARNQGWIEVWHWCRHGKYCEEKANDMCVWVISEHMYKLFDWNEKKIQLWIYILPK